MYSTIRLKDVDTDRASSPSIPGQKPEQLQKGNRNDVQRSESSAPKSTIFKNPRGYILQSKYVKEHEYVYVVSNAVPLQRSRNAPTATTDDGPFTRLTFADSVQKSLDEMHGLVGSSFERDLVLFQPSSESVLAIFKVASDHAQSLSSVISAGIQIKSNAGTMFITRFAGLLTSFDLSAVRAMVANDASSTKQKRTLQPPGRDWMQAQFSEKS